ncbi:UNVERIFIED_CONTAM: Retrovirus-related Pol polyprotein from transposon RE1 [Sesamum indicum]
MGRMSSYNYLPHQPAAILHPKLEMVFGCLCYATNTLPHKQKFDKHASKCIFLGYCQSKKTYKVYDIESNSIFTLRDVIFHETFFPFQGSPVDDGPIALPIPVPHTTSSSFHPLANKHAPSDTPLTLSSTPDPLTPQVPPHRSQRISTRPSWMSDYVCHCMPTASSCVSTSLTPAYIQFVAHLSALQEPKSYLQASKDPNWVEAMNQELKVLASNQTWILTPLPPGKSTIGSRWVYKLKLNLDGTIASKSWSLLLLDVNNAILYSRLDEDVYMDPPAGLFDVSPALLVYVDDILLTSSSKAALHSVKHYLDRLFTIKDLGPAQYFLNLELARSPHGLQVTQRKYLHDILSYSSMLHVVPASTPFPFSLKLTHDRGALLPDPSRYRRLIGRLLYLGFTRPDISFAVQQLSQFLHWSFLLFF